MFLAECIWSASWGQTPYLFTLYPYGLIWDLIYSRWSINISWVTNKLLESSIIMYWKNYKDFHTIWPTDYIRKYFIETKKFNRILPILTPKWKKSESLTTREGYECLKTGNNNKLCYNFCVHFKLTVTVS